MMPEVKFVGSGKKVIKISKNGGSDSLDCATNDQTIKKKSKRRTSRNRPADLFTTNR
jgi:hypothetical protein